MPHYNRYDSTKTKRSIKAKENAKQKKYVNNNLFCDHISEPAGIVIDTNYDSAQVMVENSIVEMKLGKNIKGICNKIVFPGDIVESVKENEKYFIVKIKTRKNLLTRKKTDSTRNNQISVTDLNIAANIDIAVIVASCSTPPFHPKFIDRYLMILQYNDIEALICLNKFDLKSEEDKEKINIYKNLGLTVIETSVKTSLGIDKLKSSLKGKQAIFLGHSGVEKSSLVNAICESKLAKIGDISEKYGKGKHTTTHTKYYLWENNSSIIDTPGIRNLNVRGIPLDEIQQYFPEFDKFKDNCKYRNCLHFKEKTNDCKVKQAVDNGFINKERYDSYIRIISQ